eukprot:COSAG06_NODE_21968_length_739_cov_0.657813_1_plen_167_part_01
MAAITTYTAEQGACRDNGQYGGWCRTTTSNAALCYERASAWSAFVAAEWRVSSGQCALLQSFGEAPTDCPSGLVSNSGHNGGPYTYSGTGDTDNVCWIAVRGCSPGQYDHDDDMNTPCLTCGPGNATDVPVGATTCTPCSTVHYDDDLLSSTPCATCTNGAELRGAS